MDPQVVKDIEEGGRRPALWRFPERLPEDRTAWTISRATCPAEQVGHGFPRVHGIEEISWVCKTREKFHATMARIFRRQYPDYCYYSAHNREVCGSKKKRHVPDQKNSDLKRHRQSGSFRVEAYAPQGGEMGLSRSFTRPARGPSQG